MSGAQEIEIFSENGKNYKIIFMCHISRFKNQNLFLCDVQLSSNEFASNGIVNSLIEDDCAKNVILETLILVWWHILNLEGQVRCKGVGCRFSMFFFFFIFAPHNDRGPGFCSGTLLGARILSGCASLLNFPNSGQLTHL